MTVGRAFELLCCVIGLGFVRVLADDRTVTICDGDHGPTTFMLLDLDLEVADMRDIGHGKPPFLIAANKTARGFP